MRRISILIVCLALSACAASKPATQKTSTGGLTISGSGVTQTETFVTAMPSGTPVVPGHGEEKGMAYGAVEGNGEASANGVATVHYLEDKTTILGVQINIKAAPDGFYYEAWLVRPSKNTRISVGHLTNPLNDVRHEVRFESPQDLSDYTEIDISLQSASAPQTLGPTVAIAKLKRVSR